jgi:RNA polymerase sigma factor (sigma-70 family)
MDDRRQFATTQWSLVLAAGHGNGDQSHTALAALCTRYWYPLYAFIRRRGHQPEEAQDLTQSFLLDLFEKDSLLVADPARGRFRSFLLASLKNFLANEHRAASAEKRGGHRLHLSIETGGAEDRYLHEPVHELTPEHIFERRWALTILDSALDDVRQQFQTQGNEALFQTLGPLLVAGAEAPPYRQLAQQLGMTAGAVKVAVHRLRRSYGEALRQRVAETVASADEVDDELRRLLATLGG